ncbi:M48 family metallopeptidase [Kitasatospora terrestris]|uniref:Peptidase M48 domain-containing protein n=1 Tax=Kitasatospora terrestris TaxID=258051 RepID=A0ABP9DPX0_9ACTN
MIPTPAAPSPAATTTACPGCAAPIVDDPRARTWCPACEWNLTDAAPVVEHRTARARRRAEREERRTAARERAVRARVEHVHGLVAADAPAHRDLSALAAYGLAGLVHLVSLGVLTGSVLLLLTDAWPARVLGSVGLLLAFLLRPRLGSFRTERKDAVTRPEAPALYGLADRVAAALGTRPVDAIVVDGSFNASFGKHGPRRRSVLHLGLPLWYALTPQQRVALLGHEFGHGVNGDNRRGLWLHSAGSALVEWFRLTRPAPHDLHREGIVAVAMWVSRLFLRAANLAAYGLLIALERLTVRAGQAAEYRADRLAADTAGAGAAAGMLAMLLNGPTVETVIRRRRAVPRRGRNLSSRQALPDRDLWAEIAADCASVPAQERERRLRLSARELGAVDSTHPPTHLRIRLLEQQPEGEPAVRVEPAELDAVEAELAPYRERIERELMAV